MNTAIRMRVTTRKKPDYNRISYSAYTRTFILVEEREDSYLVRDQTGMERTVSKNDEYFDLLNVEFIMDTK